MFQKLHHHQQACTLLYTRTFLGWDLPIFGPYVPRVCCVIPSYIVSAHLVSYCLLVRQQQRFHHPTLRTSTVILVACIEQSTISGKHVHCCILVHVFFWGGWDVSRFCTYLPRVCCVIPCPILLVRTSYDTVFSCFSCDNNSVFITLHSEQHQLLWWDVSKK